MNLKTEIKLPENLFTLLNLHLAGVALLAILNITLAARLFLAWRDSGAGAQDTLSQQQLTLAQLQAQSSKFANLPEKVDASRKQADQFYKDRIPANYSSIAAELGALAQKNNIRLTRAGYTQAPALAGLAEVRIDSNLAGEYTGMMRFINGLERDKTFFVISGLTLTGQQGGLVNVRLRLLTYLHAADAAGLPQAGDESANPSEAAQNIATPTLQPASQEVQ